MKLRATYQGCCDAAGRLSQLAQQTVTLEQLVLRAQARGEGTREEITRRIDDMLAGGLLVEVED